MKLSERQKLFCQYYAGECIGNAERSAVKAGYSPRYARGCAYRILANDGVQAYLDELTEKTKSERIATIEEIKAFWTEMMNDKEARPSDRLRAAELLAKAEGEFTKNNW